MKNTTKLTLLATTAAALVGSYAFGDDQRLQDRNNANQRDRDAMMIETTTTVGVYTDRHGLGTSDMAQTPTQELSLTQRDDGHGHTSFLYR